MSDPVLMEPDPAWAGEFTARSFRRLLIDLIWMLTTTEVLGPSTVVLWSIAL